FYQATQFRLADMEARVQAARLCWYDAAARLAAGEPVKKQAAIAKLVASNAAMDNARDATQIFGGYGCMKQDPVPHCHRAATEPARYRGCSSPVSLAFARSPESARQQSLPSTCGSWPSAGSSRAAAHAVSGRSWTRRSACPRPLAPR